MRAAKARGGTRGVAEGATADAGGPSNTTLSSGPHGLPQYVLRVAALVGRPLWLRDGAETLMVRVKLVLELAFLGTRYVGWQPQRQQQPQGEGPAAQPAAKRADANPDAAAETNELAGSGAAVAGERAAVSGAAASGGRAAPYPSPPICRMYNKGRCHKGAGCRKVHACDRCWRADGERREHASSDGVCADGPEGQLLLCLSL